MRTVINSTRLPFLGLGGAGKMQLTTLISIEQNSTETDKVDQEIDGDKVIE